MKRLKYLLFVILITLPFCSIIPQELYEIIDYHFMAVEQDKFNKLETIIIEAKTITGDQEIPLTIFHKRPNKMRTERTIDNFTSISAFNGETGWKITHENKKPEKMIGVELQETKFRADLDGYFFCYREKPHELELLGKEKVKGKEYFKIKCIKPSGFISFLFLDTKDYLLKRKVEVLKSGGTETEQTTLIGDYKKVEGIPFPHKFEIIEGGNKSVKKIISYKLNEEVHDSHFEMPKTTEEEKKTI